MSDVEPIAGQRFFWFANSRTVLVLEVESVTDDAVSLRWSHYLGLVTHGAPQHGDIEWSRAEWRAARLEPYTPPVTPADLGPGEEECRACGGSRFETERDFEVFPCVWCNGTGRQAKRPPPKDPSRRSPLHPETPA
jgi:hypothetical protein